MATERLGVLEVIGVGLTFLLLSAAGLAASYLTGILSNIDGLLMVSICLMMGLVFTAMLVAFARHQGWIGRGKPSETASATPAAAGK
jgi:hypothetical protein